MARLTQVQAKPTATAGSCARGTSLTRLIIAAATVNCDCVGASEIETLHGSQAFTISVSSHDTR